MSQELIQEIDHLRAEIQQLKEQLDERTHKNIQLTCKVEAANTITKEWCKQCGEIDFGSDDLCQCDCGIFDLKKVLAGETNISEKLKEQVEAAKTILNSIEITSSEVADIVNAINAVFSEGFSAEKSSLKSAQNSEASL